MPAYASKADILARLTLREDDFTSELLGTLRARELLRAEYRDAAAWAGDGAGSVDRWNAALFATGMIDPSSPAEARTALFTRDEVMAWPNRPGLWGEVLRGAQFILDLSEVGESPLKSDDPPPAAE